MGCGRGGPPSDIEQARCIATLQQALALTAQGFMLPYATTADLAANIFQASQHAKLAVTAASWLGAGPRNPQAIDAGIAQLEAALAERKRLRAAEEVLP